MKYYSVLYPVPSAVVCGRGSVQLLNIHFPNHKPKQDNFKSRASGLEIFEPHIINSSQSQKSKQSVPSYKKVEGRKQQNHVKSRNILSIHTRNTLRIPSCPLRREESSRRPLKMTAPIHNNAKSSSNHEQFLRRHWSRRQGAVAQFFFSRKTCTCFFFHKALENSSAPSGKREGGETC